MIGSGSAGSIDDWLLLHTEPDVCETADAVADRWAEAVAVTTPGPVGSLVESDSIDDVDWWLQARVRADVPARLTLHGVTALSTVYLNSVAVHEVESMFLPVHLNLPVGEHELVLRSRSVRRWLCTRRPRGRWRSTLVGDQGLRWLRTTMLGRAPVYGAGVLPPPVGVWRPVTLTPMPAVDQLRIDPRVDADGSAAVRVRGAATGSGSPLRLTVFGPTGAELTTVFVDGELDVEIPVEAPVLWWPRGYGAQPLYRLLVETDGTMSVDRAFGFRTVTADRAEGGFTLRINGCRVFARGVAWIPPDPVALHVTADVLRTHLTAFAEAGATMVRVVGGLVYEQPEFYWLCAELGLLVWQDAMLATFDPPTELDELTCRELTELLIEHSGNPAFAVVSGGSETEQQPEMLGLGADRRAMPLLHTGLARVVAEHGDLPYVTSSPSSPDGRSAIAPNTGVAHWFGVGGYLRPLNDVASAGVRFAAESLAFSIPPNADAVDRHFASASHAGHHPRWKAGVPRDRTASWDFEDVRDHYVRTIFDVDPVTERRDDPERALALGRLAVAIAMTHCFGFWRRSDSGCGGALVLSAKDLVAGAGWGLLDSDGVPKLPLAALRRVWAPIGVTLADDGLAGVRVDVHNDGPRALSATMELAATDALGHLAVTGTVGLTVPAHGSMTLHDPEITGTFTDLCHAYRFGPAVATGVQVRVLDSSGSELAREALVLQPARGRSGLSAIVAPAVDGWVLTVTAESALRGVCVEAPGWRCSDDCFQLIAGRPHRILLAPFDVVADGPPSGRVSSVDSVETAVIRSVDVS
jgi:beta-mannosidase